MPSLRGERSFATWSPRVLASLATLSETPAVISVNAGSVESWTGDEFALCDEGRRLSELRRRRS